MWLRGGNQLVDQSVGAEAIAQLITDRVRAAAPESLVAPPLVFAPLTPPPAAAAAGGGGCAEDEETTTLVGDPTSTKPLRPCGGAADAPAWRVEEAAPTAAAVVAPPLNADDADAEDHAPTRLHVDGENPRDELVVPPPAGPLAARARKLATAPRFNNFILACIGANCVLLASDDPTRNGPPPAGAAAFDAALSLVFAVEVARRRRPSSERGSHNSGHRVFLQKGRAQGVRRHCLLHRFIVVKGRVVRPPPVADSFIKKRPLIKSRTSRSPLRSGCASLRRARPSVRPQARRVPRALLARGRAELA